MDFEKIKFLVEEGLDKKIKESLENVKDLDHKIIESLDDKLLGKNPATLLLKNNVKTFLIIFMYWPDILSTKCETIVKEIKNLSIEECRRIKKVFEEYQLREILDFLTKAQALWYCFLVDQKTQHSKDEISKKINNARKYMGCLLAGVLLYNHYRIPIILTTKEFHPYLTSITLEDIVCHLAYYIWLDTGNSDSNKNYNDALGIFHNFIESLDNMEREKKDILTSCVNNKRDETDTLTFFKLIDKI